RLSAHPSDSRDAARTDCHPAHPTFLFVVYHPQSLPPSSAKTCMRSGRAATSLPAQLLPHFPHRVLSDHPLALQRPHQRKPKLHTNIDLMSSYTSPLRSFSISLNANLEMLVRGESRMNGANTNGENREKKGQA